MRSQMEPAGRETGDGEAKLEVGTGGQEKERRWRTMDESRKQERKMGGGRPGEGDGRRGETGDWRWRRINYRAKNRMFERSYAKSLQGNFRKKQLVSERLQEKRRFGQNIMTFEHHPDSLVEAARNM